MVQKSRNITNSVAISTLGNESIGKGKGKIPSETVVILKKKTAKMM